MIKYDVRKNSYYDSVTLMLISKQVKMLSGVNEALVGMATELNKELTSNLGLGLDLLDELSPNDFYIAADVEDEDVMKSLIELVDELLTKKKQESGSDYRPVNLKGAVENLDNANMLVVSIPGQYAEDEVMRALDLDLNVMLFSDNVSIESEYRMKKKAVEKGLLMMGPDCGTAIINGVPLAFANVLNRGNIGVVGASGTGTQEVTCIIDRLGAGVSQVIGTGGRDLKSEVGGLMMIQSIEALLRDDETEVLVLISKPPAPEVEKKILELVEKSPKPVIVDFIGGNNEVIAKHGAVPCLTLEDAAYKAVAVSKGEKPKDFTGFSQSDEYIDQLVENQLGKLSEGQVNLRALYTGGTLADEAMKLFGESIGTIYSNIPLKPENGLKSLTNLTGNVCLDLGEDQFTVGRPHPMIDPSSRSDRFLIDVDETVALILVDVVLGYGSHEDPAGELLYSVKETRERLKMSNLDVIVVASITGTQNDPQDFEESRRKLEDNDIVVMPSNAQAVRLVKKIMSRIER